MELSSSKPRVVVVALAVIAVLVAGCGGDSGSETAAKPIPETSETAAAVEGYREYVIAQADLLVERTQEFTDAVKEGDLEEAKRLFATARAPFERIEPVAGSFGDLDPKIDARANDAEDPENWTGFHRIEKALWVTGTTAGLEPIADQLLADVKTLRARTNDVDLDALAIATGATDLLGEVSKGKITGEEDRYSHTDLWDFKANVDGSEEAFNQLRPALEKVDAQLAETIEARFTAVNTALSEYESGDGFVSYTELDEADKRKLSQAIDALAEPLSQVAGKLSG